MAVAVGIHEAGGATFAHVSEIGYGEFEVVGGQRDWFAVKVPCGDDVYMVLVIGKDQRIVVDRVQFYVNDPAGIGDGITDGTVYLGNAAQCVGILDIHGIFPLHQSTSGQKISQEGGAVDLPGMGTDRVNPLIKGLIRSVKSFQAQAGGDLSGVGQINRSSYKEGSEPRPSGLFRWSEPDLLWPPKPAV